MKAILKWVRDQLGLDGDATEFDGLHPRQQEAMNKAHSVLESLFSGLDDIQAIGLDNVAHARQYVRASWGTDRDGIEITEGAVARERLGLDMATKVLWLFGTTIRWETTGNVCLVTVPSSTSSRTAVVMIVLPRMDDATGWLDWRAGAAAVSRIFDDVDEAENFLDDVSRAQRTIASTVRDLDRIRGEVRPGAGRQGPADF